MGLSGNAGASGGGFILIGPFPVVFGSGRYGGTLAELSLVLGVLMVALLLLRARRPFGAGRS
ncbi:MAG: DUF131 domain-containing protein [Thaumarchaeota archaeon]|nr:DUF131 domain-containing protein [Nitrososphaerota archaeon]